MCSAVVLLVSPSWVEKGWVDVAVEEGRRAVKRETWARARAEERVPMRRVRWEGEVVVVEGREVGMGSAMG